MIDFYKNLKSGEGRADSLRAAQLKMLNTGSENANKTSDDPNRSGVRLAGNKSLDRGKGFQHPFFRASFIQAGQWEN